MRALLIATTLVAARSHAAPPIVTGEPSTEGAVMRFESEPGVLLCTGTVIASHALLTAAHCLAGDLLPGVVIDGAARAAIVAVPSPDFEPATLAHDVAIVVIDPVGTVPLPLATAEPAIGDEVQLIGFGRTAPDDTTPPRRRSGLATIDELDERAMRTSGTSVTCEGDSGGPVLIGGAIAGVTSSGDCATFSRHARVDANAAFLASTVAATRPRAGAAGARCFYPGNCASGECLAAPDSAWKFCTPACDGGACPAGLACVADRCVHPAPSPGAFGATCTADGECAEALCLGAGDGARVCTLRCFSDLPGFDCPVGTRCAPASDGGEACLAPPEEGCAAGGTPSLLAGLLAFAQLLRGRGRP